MAEFSPVAINCKNMKKQNMVVPSLIHSLATLIYITLVASLMFFGQDLFGKMDGVFGIIAFLLLFVVSAAVVGLLVLGKPVMLYLDKQKKEAVQLLTYTVSWLLVFTIIFFVIISIINKI